MGNDIFNDEQLKYAEIVQKETEDALGWWKERALKAEAKLADKYLIEEQYETACGDRDGLLRMVETLREQKNALLAERDLALETATRERDEAREEVAEHVRKRALLMNWATDKDGTGCDGCHGSTAGDQDLMLLCQPCGEKWRALGTAPPADAATEAVREAAERLLEDYAGVEDMLLSETAEKVMRLRSALSSPAPAPSAKETSNA